jgi:hypothetical protein
MILIPVASGGKSFLVRLIVLPTQPRTSQSIARSPSPGIRRLFRENLCNFERRNMNTATPFARMLRVIGSIGSLKRRGATAAHASHFRHRRACPGDLDEHGRACASSTPRMAQCRYNRDRRDKPGDDIVGTSAPPSFI